MLWDPAAHEPLVLGGAGVVDALRRLAERGFVELRRDYLPYVDTLEPESAGPSLLMGETGVLLVRHRLEPSAATLERLRELVASNVGDAHRELLWGSPGTMLVARELGFDDLWLHSSERLLAAREPETGLWTQNLYGDELQYLGAAHGFAGCVLALGDVDGAAATARRHGVLEDGLANWPPLTDGVLVRNGTVRVQCHGTAGNGYAFLALFERTGDGRWLERARRFAAHALVQVEKAQAKHGMGRYSLWTGDLGTALFLADCLDGRGTLPLP